jgi:hypothetical protein
MPMVIAIARFLRFEAKLTFEINALGFWLPRQAYGRRAKNAQITQRTLLARCHELAERSLVALFNQRSSTDGTAAGDTSYLLALPLAGLGYQHCLSPNLIMRDIWPEPSCFDKRNAYFEAGHAVIAWSESLEIDRVSIEPDGDAPSWIDIKEPDLREVRLRSSAQAQALAKSVIRALLAGPAAQSRYSFGWCTPEFNIGDRHLIDQETAWRAISIAGLIKSKGALIPVLWREVTTIIQQPEVWAAVEAVAAALLLNGELAGCEVDEIARHAMATAKLTIK